MALLTERLRREAALLLALAIVSGCGSSERTTPEPVPPESVPPPEPAPRPADGIPDCPESARANLLASEARQCWFPATYGHWRTIDHNIHYDSIVVTVRATDLRDADHIAHAFVKNGNYTEVLLYVHPESSTGASVVRRIDWTRRGGFERLELEDPPRSEAAAK